MNYIVCAYYTVDTGYEEEAQKLITSLNTFHLPMDVVGIPSQGSWEINTHYKPYFIEAMLLKHPGKDVLYLDADAIIKQYPLLFDHVDFDVGYAMRNDQELLGGTLYFANNARVMALVQRWKHWCKTQLNIWDQILLQILLEDGCADLNLKLRQLPPTYCQIYDLMKEAGDPVIEHFQASRRLKKKRLTD